MTIRKALFNFLDEHKDFIVSGWDLYDIVHEITGRSPYPTTLLNMVRDYCDITGSDFICIDHQRSKYHFTQLVPLGDSIIDRR